MASTQRVSLWNTKGQHTFGWVSVVTDQQGNIIYERHVPECEYVQADDFWAEVTQAKHFLLNNYQGPSYRIHIGMAAGVEDFLRVMPEVMTPYTF